MARNLDALKQEWETHPCLKYIACKSVQELADHLEKIHKRLVSDDGMAAGYLYQKQIQLRKDLEQCQMQMISK